MVVVTMVPVVNPSVVDTIVPDSPEVVLVKDVAVGQYLTVV